MTRRAVTCLALCAILALASFPACSEPLPAGASFEAAFSPNQGSLALVLSTIKSAQRTIRVAAYSFTSKPIAEALLAAHKRGVDVRVVADKKASSDQYTANTFLANHGVPVRLHGRMAIMHNKFMVIDSRHVQTGSFNYSAAAAEKNGENVLVIRDAPELAAKYAAQWDRLWSEAADLPARH